VAGGCGEFSLRFVTVAVSICNYCFERENLSFRLMSDSKNSDKSGV